MVKTLIATSEAAPLASTDGLGDVCGALPKALAKLGHNVRVFLPAYRSALGQDLPITRTDVRLEIPIGTKVVRGAVLLTRLPGSEVPVYLVEQHEYFDRDGFYGENGTDYRDNCERFVFFCRAVLESIRQLKLDVDLLHCHDWQTALIPVLLRAERSGTPGCEQPASLMTIHNMAYQGRFWHWDMLQTGLDWKYFNWKQLEYYGDLNLLKGGLVFADAINTVSPTYAEEIQLPPLGCGLENVLRYRRDVLSGILNGIDEEIWNPATDPHLAATYELGSYVQGKARCKAALQAELGLPQDTGVPVLAFVGRLEEQQGVDFMLELARDWVAHRNVQWVILGTGQPEYHQQLARLAKESPQRVAVHFALNEPLAHRVEAGADIFLMPSRFEPCGTNQLQSLKYGTIPVVHATGGLADSIVNCSDSSLADGSANGFSFGDLTFADFQQSVNRACQIYRDHPVVWRQLIETGMAQDVSWNCSAGKYADLYVQTIQRVRHTVCA